MEIRRNKMENKSIEKTLREIEELKEALLRQKEAEKKEEEIKIIDIEPEHIKEADVKADSKEQNNLNAICIIEAALTDNGPVVNIKGNLIAADGLLTYIDEYIKMLMRGHINQSVQRQIEEGEAPK
jgi:hypothetical protein